MNIAASIANCPVGSYSNWKCRTFSTALGDRQTNQVLVLSVTVT